MARWHRFFTARKLVKTGFLTHGLTCCFAVLLAYTGDDLLLEKESRPAKIAVLNGGSVLKRMLSNKWLSEDERSCVNAYTSVMAFTLTPKAFARFAPDVRMCDTLLSFDGLSEFRDGWWFLSFFFDSTTPTPYSIKQLTRDDGSSVVFVKYDTVYRLRFLPVRCPMRSSARIELCTVHGEKKIKYVHHRWNNGPILGRMSYNNLIGDVGYLFRRFNGFVLSSIVTAESDFVYGGSARPPTGVV